MKILVTGCAGFIGSHLCEKLLSLNHIVYGIDNFNDYYNVKQKKNNIKIIKSHIFKKNFKFYKEDIRYTKIIDRIKPDMVCHLGGMAGVRYSLKNPELYIDINITGSNNLLLQCVNNNVKHFLYASSSSVYGLNEKVPFSENDTLNRLNSPYAFSKRSLELQAKLYHDLYKLNTIGFRFFTVYGPRGRPDMAPYKFIKNILNDIPIDKYGDGSSSRDYTFIDDIISGIAKCINKIETNNESTNKIYNLGNNTSISLNDFIDTCERVCQKKAITNIKPSQKGDVPKTYANINLAKKDFDYKPQTNLFNGLTQLKIWLNNNKRLVK